MFFQKKDDISCKRILEITYKDVRNMKIGEAQGIYREQVNAYREQKSVLSKRLQNIRSRIKTPEDQEAYGAEAATLELTLEALDEKQKEYQDYLSKLSEKYCAYWNATVAEQQKDATKEYAADMAKLLEVARRIMKGASVPASDEKKLMEFSSDMYQMAKNIGAMVQRQKREKYESLWKEDQEKKEYDDPGEVAENASVGMEGPEIVDVSDTIASIASAETDVQ